MTSVDPRRGSGSSLGDFSGTVGSVKVTAPAAAAPAAALTELRTNLETITSNKEPESPRSSFEMPSSFPLQQQERESIQSSHNQPTRHHRTRSDNDIPRSMNGQQKLNYNYNQQQQQQQPLKQYAPYPVGYYGTSSYTGPPLPYQHSLPPLQQQPQQYLNQNSKATTSGQIQHYSDANMQLNHQQQHLFSEHRPLLAPKGSSDRGMMRRSSHRPMNSTTAGAGGRRIKSRSTGQANTAEYGAFWGGAHPPAARAVAPPSPGGPRGLAGPLPSPMAPRAIVGAAKAQPFDPRNEFKQLTTKLRSGGGGSANSSPSFSHSRHRKTLSMDNPPLSPTVAFTMGHVLRTSAPPTSAWSPLTTDNFVTQKRHKAESSRRKQSRQDSAQRFMDSIRGHAQTLACRDLSFFILFVVHLLFIVLLGNWYAKEALHPHRYNAIMNPTTTATITTITTTTSTYNETTTITDDSGDDAERVTIDYANLLFLACMSGGFSIVMSNVLLLVMTIFAKHFVQMSLVVVITLSFIWGTIGIGLSPRNVVPITGIIFLALSVAYAFIVWDRIPFAAANLMTALSAIRAFPGTVLVAFAFQLVALGWSIYFCVVVVGVYDAIRGGALDISHQMAVFIYVMLGISFYWTYQVFQNSVQIVTAGVIGAWWYTPREQNVVAKQAFKSLYYSMGSVCYGSLFVGPVRFIRFLALFFRPSSDDEASLICLHECLTCIQTCIMSVVNSLVSRFSPWAFTYVGLYSYGFTEAGFLATDLFAKRGWSVIVSDDLVPNILLMTSLVIGGVTGCVCHLTEELSGRSIFSSDQPGVVAFWMGIAIGLVLTSVLFAVINSSVNTVLVCFAISPVDFENNHPELSDEMRLAWREVWPGALDVTDLRLQMVLADGGNSSRAIDCESRDDMPAFLV